MKKLLDKINELESIKEKQSIKLAKYRDEIDNVSHEVSKTRTSSDSAVQVLSQELRHLKQNLDKTLKKNTNCTQLYTTLHNSTQLSLKQRTYNKYTTLQHNTLFS